MVEHSRNGKRVDDVEALLANEYIEINLILKVKITGDKRGCVV